MQNLFCFTKWRHTGNPTIDHYISFLLSTWELWGKFTIHFMFHVSLTVLVKFSLPQATKLCLSCSLWLPLQHSSTDPGPTKHAVLFFPFLGPWTEICPGRIQLINNQTDEITDPLSFCSCPLPTGDSSLRLMYFPDHSCVLEQGFCLFELFKCPCYSRHT